MKVAEQPFYDLIFWLLWLPLRTDTMRLPSFVTTGKVNKLSYNNISEVMASSFAI